MSLGLAAGAAAADPDAARRVDAARHLQLAEVRLDAAETRARLAILAARAAEAAAAQRAAALGPLLPLLHRLALFPAETLLAAPAPPEEALRGIAVLQALSRQLGAEALAAGQAAAVAQDQAATAVREAAALAAAREQARSAAAALDAELAEAARRRATTTPDPETTAARRTAETAQRAPDLDGAVGRLRRPDPRPPEPRPPAAEPVAAAVPAPAPIGGKAQPVAGRVLRAFGAPGDGGPARGVTWQAAPGARVLSPCDGRAVFAGPFRSYGLLLIVDCGDGYHFVLAGLDRLDTATGQRLLPGEPVGRLSGSDTSRPTLYGEVRRQGLPIDPRAWLGRAAQD